MVKSVTINERLHLVIPVYAEDGETIMAYAHSAPISRDVFEAHFELVGRAFAAIYTGGLGAAGPTMASLVLQKASKDDPGEAMTLINEIRRLTNVVIRGPHGWEPFAFQDAYDHKKLSEDDLHEVSNAIVFFTVSVWTLRKHIRKQILPSAVNAWGAEITSSDFTAFVASLTTSTTADNITKLAVGSSVPY